MKSKLSKRETLIREFKKFLYDNDALIEFERNFRKYAKKADIKGNIIYHNSEGNMLSAAFYWLESPEGHEYWSRLSEKWHIQCRNRSAN
jgi:hypothetical protein